MEVAKRENNHSKNRLTNILYKNNGHQVVGKSSIQVYRRKMHNKFKGLETVVG